MNLPVKKRTNANIKVGRRLKYFRIKNQISADEMADKFGFTKDSLLRIENGSTGLSGEYANILMTEYGCDMNYLFGGSLMADDLNKIMTESETANSQQLAETLHYLADMISTRD